jgi:PAS domain S-box-containing protein
MAGWVRSRWRGPAFFIPLTYLVVSWAWVALSDRMAWSLFGDPELVERLSILKGWAFTGVGAIALHFGLRFVLRRRDAMLEELRASEARARRLVEGSPDAILIQEGLRITWVNLAAVRLLGASGAQDLVGRSIFDLIHPSDHASVRERVEAATRGDPTAPSQLRHLLRLDGTGLRAEAALARLTPPGLPATFMVTVRDVGPAWRLQEDLRRVNAALRALGACNEALVRAGSEAELMQEVCRIAVQHGGYRMAWAGTAELDEARHICPVALEGMTQEVFDALRPRWDGAGPLGQAGLAVLTLEPVVVDESAEDPRARGWLDQLRPLGLKASIALPLVIAGRRLGVLALYSGEAGGFDAPVQQLLRQLADDLAFGMEALRTRAALAQERQDLSESRRQLRALATRLEEVREEEKTRIARDLHDELGQLLTGLTMDLRWVERRLGDLPSAEPVNALLDRVVGATELADQTAAAVQRIAAELRPGALDRLGLVPALRQEARVFQSRTGIACEARLDEGMAEPSPEVATTLYRICQEAMTNVSRHAGASRVVVTLSCEPSVVVLTVEDDGRGLEATEPAPGSLGLLGMEERASRLGGSVRFSRAGAGGTQVTAWVPVVARPQTHGSLP